MQRQLCFPQPLEALTCPFHCTAGRYCQGLGEGVGEHWCQLLQNPAGFSPAQPGPTSLCTGHEFPVKGTTPGLKRATTQAEISDALASLPSLSSQWKAWASLACDPHHSHTHYDTTAGLGRSLPRWQAPLAVRLIQSPTGR